jgi:hypothetical protein
VVLDCTQHAVALCDAFANERDQVVACETLLQLGFKTTDSIQAIEVSNDSKCRSNLNGGDAITDVLLDSTQH